MTENSRPPGKTTIAPEVLVSIARLTALGVAGVNRLATIPSEVERFFSRGTSEGIKISVENDQVYIDLYVILNRDVKVREVCRAIQQQVARAVSELVGMEVGRVNVHVEDIETGVTIN
ncbi:MAG: Asp23/Gls24 family envelope stress response protein [Bellilinea sp.]